MKKRLENHHVEHSISMFQTGKELLQDGFFDIILLDIEMDGPGGIETAQKLRQLGCNSRIVFLTSHKKYVFAAFDVSASHYLLKPLDVEKLEQVLMKIINELTKEKEYCCTVKCGTEIHRIPFSQIKYVEIMGRKISLHTKDNAIAACRNLTEKERWISARAFVKQGQLVIEIKNSKPSYVTVAGGEVSPKEVTADHGIGLDTVKTVVAQYGGTLDLSADKAFCFSVLVPPNRL